jgi:uroporphyrinogen decarboxylase
MTDTQPAISSRDRLRAALHCQPLERPPVWMMRQAGRALPEYRALKEKYTFLQLVQNPELACEVTLQPLRRFGFDAAILFSDILVINEALGQPYRFREEGGIEMEVKIQSAADVDQLSVKGVTDRLLYVADALKLIRRELGDSTGLLGFAGAPWTLACFMLEGGSAREFTQAKRLFYTDRALFDRVCEKLTAAVTAYLKMQVECGVDAVQIFDTLGGTLADHAFNDASAKWIKQIIADLGGQVPVIVFSRGATDWKTLVGTGANVLGIDWTVNLAHVRKNLKYLRDAYGPEKPDIGVQGNLDPALLETNPGVAAAETRRILDEMRGLNGHIFNLGHGVRPSSKLECMSGVVETVKNFK